MKLTAPLLAIVPALAFTACTSSTSTAPSSSAAPAAPMARAAIEARSGSSVTGSATFTETDGAVQVLVEVSGAPQGLHAVHLHETGDCSAPDAMSAGAHFNPTSAPHGAPDATAHHAGDFGNLSVGDDGKGRVTLRSTMLTIAPGPNSVVGKAIIVHAKEDDMTTQPTGNAGGRIGCGVVK